MSAREPKVDLYFTFNFANMQNDISMYLYI